jgi:hypothetical protein
MSEAFKLAYDGRAAYGTVTGRYGDTFIIDGVGADQGWYFTKKGNAVTRYMNRKVALDSITKIATDPPVSQAQRAAMHAAAQGHSTIGIPKSVGKEFSNADPGGKLPEHKAKDCMDFKGTSRDGKTCNISRAADMSDADWHGLTSGLKKYFQEEQQEQSHDGGSGSGRQPLREECPGGAVRKRIG